MLIATAGHVDHGKTSLLHRLTGVDTTHLPEEKKRGLTIDLGFAYLPLGDRTLGFIDVPGHERFLSNMLAGVAGIDMALLLVACDDGVMPQTREHLAILELLGIRRAVVALSKTDLVSMERVAEVEKEVRRLFAAGSLRGSPLIATSSESGRGIATLKNYLLTQEESPHPALNENFRLAIDRVFTLSGAGLVVTGTVFSGEVRVGDTLYISRINQNVRVRSLHAMNQSTPHAHAGQRLALNLVGHVERAMLRRGDWLLAQPTEACSMLDVWLQAASTLPRVIKNRQAVHVHAAAAHTTGRLSLLQHESLSEGATLARLHLDTPLYCCQGDRLIVRDASALYTLAGCTVLDLHPPTRGQRHPQRLALLHTLHQADVDGALMALVECDGVSIPRFAQDYNLPVEHLAALARAHKLTLVGTHESPLYAWLPERWQALQQTVLTKLALAQESLVDQAGVSSEKLHRLACPALPQTSFFMLRDELLASGQLHRNGPWLHLPGFTLSLSATDAALWLAITEYFTVPYEPLWVRDLAKIGNLPEKTVRDLLKKAVRSGHAVAIVQDRYLPMSSVQQLADIVRELAQQERLVTATAFRDRIALGRKLAIQILEFFDRSGLTRRCKDHHTLRDANQFGINATDSV